MIIREKISREELENFFDSSFEAMLKIVVDIEKKILSLGCEFHIDCAEELANDGSLSKNLWGANLYRKNLDMDFVSLINIKPAKNNKSTEIQNEALRKNVEEIIKNLLCY